MIEFLDTMTILLSIFKNVYLFREVTSRSNPICRQIVAENILFQHEVS